MKNNLKIAMLTAAFTTLTAVAACAGGERTDPLAQGPRDVPAQVTPPVPVDDVPAAPALPPAEQTKPGGTYELRLLGTDAAGWSRARLPVKEVVVTGGGYRLPVEFVPTTVDLAYTQHAWRVARVFVPDGVDALQVTLVFDEGGTFARGGEQGALATRVAPVHFAASRAELQRHGHAVVHVDVERSFPRLAGERVLLPRLTVRF